ncbi:unnamed protein product [Camellia sinensis]
MCTPQKHQKYVSHVLGLPMSKVARSAFLAAVASVSFFFPPILDRDIDMMTTEDKLQLTCQTNFRQGYRYEDNWADIAFLESTSTVGFKNDGKVLALDLEIYNNAGNSLDLSIAILERAMFHSDNVYEIPNVKINGRVCFTNFPSNTAFRGFGGPQGMLITENWVQRIALELKKSPEEIRQLWNELKSSCDFLKARKEVEKFNFHNRWKKRGAAMVPTNLAFRLQPNS